MVGDAIVKGLNLPVIAGAIALFLLVVALLNSPTEYDPSFYPSSARQPVRTEEQNQDDESIEKNRRRKPAYKPGHVYHVVVLGDIGRSPRMQYHAISIAKHGGSVYLYGYTESQIHPDVLSNPLIQVVSLSSAPSILRAQSKLLFPILAPLRVCWQAASLFNSLCYSSPPARWMLVQNPPSIPTLAIASFVCYLRNTKLVIDWHNFGYSILGLKLGDKHPLVRISAIYERMFSKCAHNHFTVTHAMAQVMKREYGVEAFTLHDRPASLYRPISPEERTKLLGRLPETSQYADALVKGPSSPWKLLVSSTSWTPDEDFSVLLDALSAYSAQATSHTKLPKILVVITGKGPLKEHYLSEIKRLNEEGKLQNVVITTAWLSPADYASLLASADLGVSLHTSSSGVDLPMKVVDMFGAGLPVVGWSKFEAWPELVKEDVNGKGFSSSEKLLQLLVELFGDNRGTYERLKGGALEESKYRWDEEWDKVAGNLFGLP